MEREGLEHEVHVDGILIEHVSNLNIWDVLDESGTDGQNPIRT